MIVPVGTTTEGDTVCVIERSAEVTVTEDVAVLFALLGSAVVAPTVTESVIMLPVTLVPGLTVTTTVNVAVLPDVSVPKKFNVQLIVPVPPTAGWVPQVQLNGAVTEEKVVFVGVVCVNETREAEFGPLFVTIWV